MSFNTVNKKIIVALMSVVFISSLALTCYHFINQRSLSAQAETERLKSQILSLSFEVDNSVIKYENLVRNFATYRTVIEGVSGGDPKSKELLQDWLDKQSHQSTDFEAIYTINKEGICTLSSDPKFVGVNYTMRPYFQKAIKGNTYVSDWTIGITSGVSGIYFSAPIKVNNEIQSVMVLKISTKEIESILARISQNNKGMAAYILNKMGVILAHSNPQLQYHSIAPLSPAERKEIVQSKQFANKVVREENIPGLRNTVNAVLGNGLAQVIQYPFQGEDKIAALTRTSSEPWVVGVVKPVSSIYVNENELLLSSTIVALISLIVAIGIGIILSTRISKPIQNLTHAMESYANGERDIYLLSTSRDEIGVLTDSFNTMRVKINDFQANLEKKVQERTQEVVEEKRKISDLLNNMKQAVFKINAQLKVQAPVSRYTSTVFGLDIEGYSIFEVLYDQLPEDSECLAALKSSLVSVFEEDDLQWSLSEDGLIHKITRINPNQGKQVLHINYAPLWDAHGKLEEIMLVVEDITEMEILAGEKRSNEESIIIIQNISTANLEELKNCFSHIKAQLDQIKSILNRDSISTDDIALMLRNFHTLKGNSRVFGLSLLSPVVHSIESDLIACQQQFLAGGRISEDFIAKIQLEFFNIEEIVERYFDIAVRIFKMNHDLESEKLQIPKHQIQMMQAKLIAFKENFKAHQEVEEIISIFNALFKVKIKSTFQKYESMIADLNLKLNKKVELVLEGDDIEVYKKNLDTLHDAFIHAIRNAIDHGVEDIPTRLALGKSPLSKLKILFSRLDQEIQIKIQDDGAGIPIAKVVQKAIAQGVISQEQSLIMSEQEKMMLIFVPHISSADVVSDLSGRGVGMDVVKRNVELLGAKLSVHSQVNLGTELIMSFPLAEL